MFLRQAQGSCGARVRLVDPDVCPAIRVFTTCLQDKPSTSLFPTTETKYVQSSYVLHPLDDLDMNDAPLVQHY
jgi:hypothetical protein